MDVWWKKHEEDSHDPYTREEVEYLTGCNPLFLQQCFIENKFDVGADIVNETRKGVAINMIQKYNTGKTSDDWLQWAAPVK